MLKACDAGVDVADAAIASMSGGTSQPNLNSIVEALRHTPRDTQLDVAALNECSDYWEVVRTYYLPFDSGSSISSSTPPRSASRAPVSYTHLDVYKRQFVNWPPGISCWYRRAEPAFGPESKGR